MSEACACMQSPGISPADPAGGLPSPPATLAVSRFVLLVLATPTALIGQDHWSANEVMRVTDVRFFNIAAGELSENGEIWIANEGTSQVLHFSGNGKPLDAFGREGRGPGEFLSVSDVSVAGDSIVVSDLRLGRLTIFDRAGSVLDVQGFEGAWWLGAEFVDRLDDGSVVLLKNEAAPAEMIGHVRFEAVLYRTAEVGSRPDIVDRFDGREVFYRQEGDIVSAQSIPFARDGIAATSGSVVAYGTSDDSIIHRYAPGRELEPAIIPQKPAAVTPALLRREQRRILGLTEDAEVPRATRARMADVPVPDVLPLFEAVAVGDDGSVWMIPPTSTSDEAVSVLVIRADGSDAKVIFTRRLKILDITLDTVLAVEWDAFDVESAVIYRITPDAPSQ